MDFTPIQATRLTGCSVSQVRYWDRVGLVRPSHRADGIGKDSGKAGGKHSGKRSTGRRSYSFRDLVALRMVRSLLDAGLSLQRIRKAVQFLQDSGEALNALSLVSDGASVLACRDDGEVLDALKGGQLALFVSVDAVVRDVEAEVAQFATERDAFLDALQEDAR